MKKHILLIDDEATIREMLEHYLSTSGYQVTSVAGVREALRVFPSENIDLVITDLQLEDGDGFEIIKQFREKLPDLPIILLTGVLFDVEVSDKVLLDTVSCYLGKTTPLAKIGKVVKSLLEKSDPK